MVVRDGLTTQRLELLPDGDPSDGAVTYWGVDDVVAAVEAALSAGGVVHSPVSVVGEGIVTASIKTPDGSIVGLIYNPHFTTDH